MSSTEVNPSATVRKATEWLVRTCRIIASVTTHVIMYGIVDTNEQTNDAHANDNPVPDDTTMPRGAAWDPTVSPFTASDF